MKKELTGRHVFLMLAAFFGAYGANVDLVLKAQGTFSGEDERKSYLQGLAFNRTLAQRAEQARLGWRAEITARRQKNGTTDIQIAITQAGGDAPGGLILEGRLRHPADARLDREMTFKPHGDGRCRQHTQRRTRGVEYSAA